MLYRCNHGFSLFELIITLAVISILCALALPTFRSQGQQANRLVAETKLLTWQLDETVVPEEDNYHYRLAHHPSSTSWEAISAESGPCQHLVLTEKEQSPTDCWVS